MHVVKYMIPEVQSNNQNVYDKNVLPREDDCIGAMAPPSSSDAAARSVAVTCATASLDAISPILDLRFLNMMMGQPRGD